VLSNEGILELIHMKCNKLKEKEKKALLIKNVNGDQA
jgi:hypothetical protein